MYINIIVQSANSKFNFQKIWRPFMVSARAYISNLKALDGTRMCLSRKKTPFVGFMIGTLTFEKVPLLLIVAQH